MIKMNFKNFIIVLLSTLVAIGLMIFPAVAEASVKGEQIARIATKHMLTEGSGNPNTNERIQYSQSKRYQDGYGDCSTFSQKVYAEAGIYNIGTYTAEQISNPDGMFISRIADLQRGDLIFFTSRNQTSGHSITLPNGNRTHVSHVGIYMGYGNFIDLSNSQGTITPRTIFEPILSGLFIGGKRFVNN